MAAARSSDATGEAVRGLAVRSGFPDLELPDHAGNTRRLSELAGEDPVLLTFYRGWWCPKEQAFFRQLVRFQDEVEVAYTRMVSVSVDPPEVESAFRAGSAPAGRSFPMPSAATSTSSSSARPRTRRNPYMPAAFVLRPDLEIASAYAGYWFWGRPTLAELHRDLREVTRAVRDQWLPPA